jgi:hypothetical protein
MCDGVAECASMSVPVFLITITAIILYVGNFALRCLIAD